PIAPRTAPSVSFLDRFMNSSGVGWTCREAIDPTRETTEDRQRRFQAVPPHEAVPAGSGGTSGGRGRQAMIVRRNARPRPGPGPAPLSMWILKTTDPAPPEGAFTFRIGPGSIRTLG